MKTIKVLLCASVMGVSLAAAAAQEAKAPAEKKQEVAKPVAADAEYMETLEDAILISAEIARIERASGNVEIPVSVEALRARQEMKSGRLAKWRKDHGVGDDWQFNAKARQFDPPALKEDAKAKTEAPASGKK